MFPAQPAHDNDDHDDPAAFWFARMNSGAQPAFADEIAFRAWIDADPAHIEAYRQCQVAWRALGLDAGAPEILALRSKALKLENGAVTRRRALFGLTGGAFAAAGAGVWVLSAASPAKALIVTKAGQRMTAPLPDGSEATLAPLTRLRLDYGEDRRRVRLEAGQAYFNIAADGGRALTVIAGDRVMTASAGRFQVTLLDHGPDIVVEEGVLTVADRRDRKKVLGLLGAGQRAIGDGSGMRVGDADVESATAWRLGRLVVRDQPLSEVVQTFNRYSSERLVIGDDRAGKVRISGSFRYDGGRDFALALASGFDLAVARRPDGAWRIDASEGTATLR